MEMSEEVAVNGKEEAKRRVREERGLAFQQVVGDEVEHLSEVLGVLRLLAEFEEGIAKRGEEAIVAREELGLKGMEVSFEGERRAGWKEYLKKNNV